MNETVSIRNQAAERLRSAKTSPRVTTLLFLLIMYAVVVPCNLFTIFYSHAAEADLGGLAAISRTGRYYTWLTAAPLVLMLLNFVWDGVYTGYSIALYRDSSAGLRSALDALQLLGKLIVLSLLVLLFTFLWMCLFIIPGIVAFYRYRFSFQILFDVQDISPLEAISLSKELTDGYKLQLFMIDASFLYYLVPLQLCNYLINLPEYAALPVTGVWIEVAFYLIGTAIAILFQSLFLPHHRMSYTVLYMTLTQKPLEEQTFYDE